MSRDPSTFRPLAPAQLAALLGSTRQGLCAADLEGRITFVNRAACALLGMAEEELLGQDVQRFLGPPDQRGQSAQLSVRRPDGSSVTLACVEDPLLEDGRRVGAVHRLEDVTERERTERTLRETQRMLSTLIANLPGIAYRCANDPEWTMEFISEGTLALTGYPPERFVGPGAMPFSELVVPSDREGIWELVQEALAERRPYQLTFRIRSASGQERWLWEQGRGVFTPEGELLALEGFIIDITERKRIEAQLVASDRMASVGLLAAGIAHEINNPLAFVQANLAFVRGQLTSALLEPAQLEEARHALEEALEGTGRMRDIVRDLRSYSRADDRHPEAVDLERVLDSASGIAANEVRHRARLVRERGPCPLVWASEGRLVQVFVNLLVNAAHALPEGQVERHQIRLRTGTAPDGQAQVEVQDTGGGIPPEVLPRLFEPFFTTKPPGRGTGLGLAICQGIVNALGGSIAVESQVGQGSTFRVRLPPAPPSALGDPEPPEAPAAAPAPRRGRILVIDDEAMVGAAIRRTLARAHEVHVTTRADEALERLAQGEHFDVVICDLMMPHMSGMDFHAALAERAPALLPRVVFLTGGGFTPRARAFLESVPNVKMDKPFDPEALKALVQARLRGA